MHDGELRSEQIGPACARIGIMDLQSGNDTMINSRKFAVLTALALCAFAAPASAQSVTRLPLPSGTTPIVSAVTVPPGYTT
jgi:hypothetical protein